MSTRQADFDAAETRTAPVFVDDSGRRRRRLRALGRVILAGAGLYVALVILGLMGSLSLPVVHVGEVPRLPTSSAGSLGALNRTTVIPPAELHPNEIAGLEGGVTAPVEVPATGTRVGLASSGVNSTRSTIVPPGAPVTTVPVVVTTVPTSPTTRAHGGGPPTSRPGKGHR